MSKLHFRASQFLSKTFKESNSLLISKDFDGDGLSERIGISVSTIIVLTSDKSKGNYLVGDFESPETFLRKFSRYNFEKYCLGMLFTNRVFDELVLGQILSSFFLH